MNNINMKLYIFAFICIAWRVPALAQRNNVRRQVQQNCVTPENYYGYCVTLTYCPQVINVFQTQNQRVAQQYVFALQRSCGTRSVNNDPVVCCTRPVTNAATTQRPVTQAPNPFFPQQPTTMRNPRNPNTVVTTQRPTQSPTIRPVPVTTTTTMRPSAPLIDNRAPSCRAPDYRDGVCIALESCEELLNELRQKQTDATFANYLRASNTICGRTGSIVCCPSIARQEVSTSSPPVQNNGGIPRRLPTVDEGCGYTKNAFKKIVGGEVSKRGAWPWIALLGYDDDLSASPFKCGGTLVSARHVITAAHCIRNDLAFVRLGEHDLTTDREANHVDIRIVKNIAHPQYDKLDGHSDIAVLYLERNVDFTDFISPICMPITPTLRQKSYVQYTPFVIGWGKTMEGGQSANVLQELQIPIFDNAVCRDRYQKQNRLKSEKQFNSAVICAGVLSGGMDTCQGDSGGPLMIPEPYKDDVRYFLIGVVSYGIGCARPEVPGVYTSTQFFIDWIAQQVAQTP